VLLHTVGLCSEGGIHHDQIGVVLENAQLVKMIQDLNFQLEKSNSLMGKHQSDTEQVEHKLRELYNTVAAAEETLDHLLSTNHCGKNNDAIRSAHNDISRFRAELNENERKLSANKFTASQVSETCDRLNSEIIKIKKELEARMKEGLGIATLAGAATIFLSFFGK
jgi:chromosome segregation ATPase